MIPKDHKDRQLQGRRQFLDENLSLLRQAVVGEIPADQDHVRVLSHLQEQSLEIALGRNRAMEVGNSRDSNAFLHRFHLHTPSLLSVLDD